MTIKRSDKILRTKKEIMVYLDISSDDHFALLVKRGLPVIVIGRDYYGHKDNLDDFFQAITRKGIGVIQNGVE